MTLIISSNNEIWCNYSTVADSDKHLKLPLYIELFKSNGIRDRKPHIRLFTIVTDEIQDTQMIKLVVTILQIPIQWQKATDNFTSYTHQIQIHKKP